MKQSSHLPGHIRVRKDKYGQESYQLIVEVWRNGIMHRKAKTFPTEEGAIEWGWYTRRQIDDLDAEIKECKVLFGPYSPLKGYRVAMIEEQGVPIELVETSLTDEELSVLEQEKLGKSY